MYKIEKEYTVFQEEKENNNLEIGCRFCFDNKNKKSIELFYLDRANNMRPCTYCPSCGRKYLEV